MPVFVEDPAQFSKSRLKSDLIAHNVALPPSKCKKEVYVDLYMKHVDQKNAADFSSDEEDQVQDVAQILFCEEEEDPDDTEMPDPSGLTDDDLKAALLSHGVKAGPIVASTRALYEKKLRKLLVSDGYNKLSSMNGAEKGVLYSDSEEELENGEEDNEESGSEGAKQETAEQRELNKQESSQVELLFQKGGYVYPQCFLPSSRLEPVKDTFKDLFPDTKTTPTGIHATRRRPIKGAAGRPVQYAYADIPASPTTLERREVERCLVPIQIQILVFLIVAFLLYFVYVCIEDDSFSPFAALLDSISHGSNNEEGHLLQSETQDTPALFGQV
ncbi:hypothetical protein PAMP_012349 [Pampus punctatissimus]